MMKSLTVRCLLAGIVVETIHATHSYSESLEISPTPNSTTEFPPINRENAGQLELIYQSDVLDHPYALAWHPYDTAIVVSSPYLETAPIRFREGNQRLPELELDIFRGIGVAFHPDGNVLVVGEADTATDFPEEQIRLWTIEANDEQVTYCPTPQGTPNFTAFHPDSFILASGEAGGTLQFWDITAEKCTQLELANAGYTSVHSISPNWTTIVTGDDKGTLLATLTDKIQIWGVVE